MQRRDEDGVEAAAIAAASTPSSSRRCIRYGPGLHALTVVPRAPNFCALRRVSSNLERA